MVGVKLTDDQFLSFANITSLKRIAPTSGFVSRAAMDEFTKRRPEVKVDLFGW
ncbi:MAG TPA: hypothetical protein VNC50_00035 [Planctomycetia bacterium]|nr:hypothetical protein [Planctomycetia bacterium]